MYQWSMTNDNKQQARNCYIHANSSTASYGSCIERERDHTQYTSGKQQSYGALKHYRNDDETRWLDKAYEKLSVWHISIWRFVLLYGCLLRKKLCDGNAHIFLHFPVCLITQFRLESMEFSSWITNSHHSHAWTDWASEIGEDTFIAFPVQISLLLLFFFDFLALYDENNVNVSRSQTNRPFT